MNDGELLEIAIDRMEDLQIQAVYVADEIGYLRRQLLQGRLALSASGSEGSEECTPSKPAVDQRAKRADTSWVDPFSPTASGAEDNHGTW